MALKEPAGAYTTEKLGATKEAMEEFLRRPDLMARTEELIASGKVCHMAVWYGELYHMPK